LLQQTNRLGPERSIFSAKVNGLTYTSSFTGFAEIVVQPVGSTQTKITIAEPNTPQNVDFSLILGQPWVVGGLLSGLGPLTTTPGYSQTVILQTNNNAYDYITFDALAAVPEADSLALFGMGLAAVGLARRRGRLKLQ
jgi:hypothetical protein